MNIFNNPQKYLEEIKKVRIPKDIMEEKKLELVSLSQICIEMKHQEKNMNCLTWD